jgi:WD40 repeat protein
MPSIYPPFSYQIGGSLGVKSPCYVERQADLELYEGLKAGMFCYVLNSRQMGKSSLRVQAMHRLHQDGIACGVIDITAIGSQEITVEQWYASILSSLVSAFRLDINLRDWWRENLYLSPIKRLSKFVEDVLLVESSRNMVIFIDEIDSILGLPFSVDDFFAWIRSCYNKRTDQPAYQRITFVLLGVATPADLMTDKNRTPFNIGKAISLNGFELHETEPLAQGFQGKFERPQAILAEVLNWTGGQPFLTQRICQILSEEVDSSSANLQRHQDNLSGSLADWVADVVHRRVISNWASQDEPEHLKTIRDRLLRNKQQSSRLLGLYGQISENSEINFGDEPEQMDLLLSGLVVKRQSATNAPVLQVYNRIYQTIFSRAWLEKELAKLRPYADCINIWLAADGLDESRLLRGSSLQAALTWASDKKLSNDDYRFLNASQALESYNTKLSNEQRLSLILKRFLAAALLAIFLLIGLSGLSFTEARQATISEITALNSFATNFYNNNSQSFTALISSLQAGRKLSSMWMVPPELKFSIQSNLQKNLLAVKERNRFQGHTAPVMGAAFSPDGQTIASASWDGNIKLWHPNGQEFQTLKGHSAELWNVVFSPDGQTLASASSDQTVKLWSRDGTELHTLMGHTGVVGEVVFSPDGQMLASAGVDGLIKLWDINGKQLQSFQAHHGWVWGLQFSPDGQMIASGGADKLIKLWDLTGQELKTISGHQDMVTEVLFSADGQHLASASNDGTVRLWTIAGQEIQTLEVAGAQIWDLCWSPDGQTLAAASSDNTVRLWNLADRQPRTFKTSSQVSRLNFSPDGKYLLMASWDHSMKLWQVADRATESQVIAAHNAQITDLNFSHNGQTIATTSWDRTIKLWDITGKALKTLEPDGQSKNYAVWSTVFSPDDQTLAAVMWDGQIVLWQNGQKTGVIPGANRLRTSFSPDGQSIVAAGTNNTFDLWSLQGKKLHTFAGHSTAVNVVKFSHDGEYLVSGSADNSIKLWTASGKLLKTLVGHAGEVTNVSFSPNDQMIISGSVDRTIRLWNLQGKEIQKFAGHSGAVNDVGFSPDGQWLASASADKSVRLWNLQGKEVQKIDKHTAAVTSLAFSPDGTMLASGGFDNQLVLVDLHHVQKTLPASLADTCDWLSDYLQTNPQAAIADRQFCSKYSHQEQGFNSSIDQPHSSEERQSDR